MIDTHHIVRNLVADTLGLEPSEVTLKSAFITDLRADSLDKAELMVAFEEEFDIGISDAEAEEVRTVGDAVDLITRLTGEAAGKEGQR